MLTCWLWGHSSCWPRMRRETREYGGCSLPVPGLAGVLHSLLVLYLSSGSCTCLQLGGYAGQRMPQLRCSKCIDIWTFVNIRAR